MTAPIITIALFNPTIADPYDVTFSHNTCGTDRRQLVPKGRPLVR